MTPDVLPTRRVTSNMERLTLPIFRNKFLIISVSLTYEYVIVIYLIEFLYSLAYIAPASLYCFNISICFTKLDHTMIR